MKTIQEVKRGNNVKGYPASSQLATVSDLSSQKRKAVVEAVNPLIADAFALYVKTKNFHWHVYGPQFRDYHLLFDEQAQSAFESIDIMAERVRKMGGTTIRSISHISQLQTIEDDNSPLVAPEDMVNILMEDNAKIAKNIREAIDVCEKNDDTATANQLQDILDQTERRTWFLFEVLQGNGTRTRRSGKNNNGR